MNTVFAGEEIVFAESNQPDGVTPGGREIIPAREEFESLTRRRFGIADIWKIHRGKRYANVYPRRAG